MILENGLFRFLSEKKVRRDGPDCARWDGEEEYFTGGKWVVISTSGEVKVVDDPDIIEYNVGLRITLIRSIIRRNKILLKVGDERLSDRERLWA